MASAPKPPAPPHGVGQPKSIATDKEQLEDKIGDLEKRLSEEKEKALRADLKNQEEATSAAKVEVSIKELQDKIRRDRREGENHEARLKLENENRELEARLNQERETWVSTLKNQMLKRESQDKELETHFTVRIQEMERRWLEEKAGWQKSIQSKEEENRSLRNLADKLKGVDAELSRVSMEKKALESRTAELAQERADYYAKAQGAIEKEKEIIQLRADLGTSRQQSTMLQEKLERDMQVLRLSSKDREDRLLIDLDRLQRDLATVTERLRHEYEGEIKRIKRESEAEIAGQKAASANNVAEIQKMKGVGGALERQLAASRVQIHHFQKAQVQWEKAQERYKAEFVVLQRRWLEREKEIKAEMEKRAGEDLENEIARQRLELEDKSREREALALQDHEDRAAVLENKEKELSEKLSLAEQARMAATDERLTLGKELESAREELGALKAALSETREKYESQNKEFEELSEEKTTAQRLSMAQAAEIKNLQDSFLSLRGQLAKDVHMAKAYLEEKDKMEKRIKDLEVGASGSSPAFPEEPQPPSL